ncbi:hypothetical protein NE553_14990, partial [Eggerthella lenta]|nr:hypothetical protein [Eggerthella lenta]
AERCGLDRRELGALILYVEEHGFETIQDELALTRDEVAGTAPVVESPAVLRHVLGSYRKECSWTHRQS